MPEAITKIIKALAPWFAAVAVHLWFAALFGAGRALTS